MDFPVFPIGPVLLHYGGELPMEDRGWHACKCPFHGDRSASASVNTMTNVFNCHACERGGNAVQLIMQEEGLPYARAVERAKEISGDSVSSVHGESGGGDRVSRRQGNRSVSSAAKRAGSRARSSSGSRSSRR